MNRSNEALDSLPEGYRQVVALYYLGGMSGDEIARFLGTSPSNVRQRMSRARARLKEEMIAMMSTTLERQRLPATFTFRIVEAVKRIKIQPVPRMGGVPWGLSLAAGIIIAILNIGSHLILHDPSMTFVGLPTPGEAKMPKIGEIPVDILRSSEITFLSSKQGSSNGKEAMAPKQQNADNHAAEVKCKFRFKWNSRTFDEMEERDGGSVNYFV